MFKRMANTMAEALNNRYLPNRISQHEEGIRRWLPYRYNGSGLHNLARTIIRGHIRAIRELRANLQRR